MFSIRELRCRYDEKLKDDKDQRKKINAWKKITERVGISVESCINVTTFVTFVSSSASLVDFPANVFFSAPSTKTNNSRVKVADDPTRPSWELDDVQIQLNYMRTFRRWPIGALSQTSKTAYIY